MSLFFRIITFTLLLAVGKGAVAAAVELFDSPAICSEIRLDGVTGPFSRLPVYNQSLGTEMASNICYAITASQLMDAYKIVHGDQSGSLSSPVSIALRTRLFESVKPDSSRKLSYDDSDPLSFLIGGGSIAGALNYNRDKPLCDQKWLDSYTTLLGNSDAGDSIDKFVLGLVDGVKILAPNRALIQMTLDRLTQKCAGHVIDTKFPNVGEQSSPGGDFLEANYELVKKLQDPDLTSDQRKTLVNEFNERFDPERKIQLFAQTINHELEKDGSTGIGIGYLYRALRSNGNRDSIGAHASVIIGRRINPVSTKCEYLVRDSFGMDCRAKDGTQRYELPCVNGSVWVEARDLLKDTMNLTWIP